MDRWDRVGRNAAYGTALALSPYLLIKVSWVIGSLVGVLPIGEGFGLAGWLVLNTVTVGMAVTGIALVLALVRPWGMRIPGALVTFCSWVGSGFLVSVLPFAAFSALLGGGGEPSGGDDTAMPVWEGVLIEFSFVGMGLGLALAVPAYLRRRWPDAFAGRVGDGPRGAVPWAAVVGAVVGLVWLHWAAGGTLGIAHPAERTTDGEVLAVAWGFWAIAGSAAVWTLARARPAGLPRWLPLVIGWVGSGSLFAWSAWKVPLVLYVAMAHPADVTPPENPAVALALHLCAVVAGAAMMRTLARTRYRGSRGAAIHDTGRSTAVS
ncbi:hypothetical protein OHS33_31865 [Streptomyces sp. NBC_00536]|uniref:hypothetical protein n=1 Tax=Streptomyces sp. NBC_00536 TaxID=2975769 RepID=UPI002E80D528|nr:hypothetical protein [Streptomyces sp. NBC_00536]WUC82552.1 hypothetical protein OHS33_31865 [Streptomyces sp. NBC_00536]